MRRLITTVCFCTFICTFLAKVNGQEMYMVNGADTKGTAQSNDTLFYRHSFQSNIIGLPIERWGMAYELRMTPRHAIFIQGGGSFPFISEEKEYGFGLHYKYFLQPVRDAKFLWLFKSAYRNSFVNINIRYMNLDGIHNGAESLYEAFLLVQAWAKLMYGIQGSP